MPAVIIVTTRRPPAVAAIDEPNVHHVLKPFSSERIHEALTLAIGRRAHEPKVSLSQIRLLLVVPLSVAIRAFP